MPATNPAPPITNANLFDKENVPRIKEMIRAGAVFPNAVPGAFSHPPESPTIFRSRNTARYSRRNALLMPAFGATRNEGAVGPVEALSPYADAARLQCHRPTQADNSKACRTKTQVLQSESLEIDVPKGPTAEAILSLTSSGRKPPVPETRQLEKHEKSLSKISREIERAAYFYRISDRQKNNETYEDLFTIPKKVPGYPQTWGVAFSQDQIAVNESAFGPGGARYPENYPPGLIKQGRINR